MSTLEETGPTTHPDLVKVVDDLDKVLHELGNDLSEAVLSEGRVERQSAVGLRQAVDALQTARDVVNAYATGTPGAGVAVHEGT